MDADKDLKEADTVAGVSETEEETAVSDKISDKTVDK